MEERRTKLLEDERTLSERMEKAAEDLSALEVGEEDQAKPLHEQMGKLAMDLMTIRKELSKIEKLEDQPHKLQTSSEELLCDVPDQFDILPISGKKGNSVTVKIKPPRFKKDGDIWIFLDRFEQYLRLSGDHDPGSVELVMLNLIDDDRMYRKLRSTFAALSSSQHINTSTLLTAIRRGLYPDAESRTLKDAMSQLKQKSDESADDYTIRIESEAAKAFSPLEEAVKNEACLSALSNGLRSLDIRRRIKEAEVKSFEKAARLLLMICQ